MTELSFGPCSKCSQKVTGHAVYLYEKDITAPPQLICSYCELDTRYRTAGELLEQSKRQKGHEEQEEAPGTG